MFTYHCLCTNLILGTTFLLSRLPQRAKPCLDSAYILPCPSGSLDRADLDSGDFGDDEDLAMGGNHTFLLSLTAEGPLMIRGEEGFEKRWPLRCKRCKLIVGYQLDSSQFKQNVATLSSGKKDDVIYLLPGAMVTTEEMREGKMPSEKILA